MGGKINRQKEKGMEGIAFGMIRRGWDEWMGEEDRKKDGRRKKI